MALLNTGSPTTTIALTAGKTYIFGATGAFRSCRLKLEHNLSATLTEWENFQELDRADRFYLGAAGPSLRVTLVPPPGLAIPSDAAVNVEATVTS